MTAKGLFRALQKSPDAVFVLEDVERLTTDRDAQSFLRAALWSQGARARVLTWTTGDGEERFEFRGSLIMTANRPLSSLPELRALATRISVMKMDISEPELAAQMRRIARQGWARYQHRLDPEEGAEVCEHVLEECRAANCPIDLRLFDNGCCDFLQWQSNNANVHWRDLVANRVREAARHFRHPVASQSSAERQAAERALVRQIISQTDDPAVRRQLWEEKTGKSKSAFYERVRQVELGEFDVDG
jgi:hypothetical protein